MPIHHLHRSPALSLSQTRSLIADAQAEADWTIDALETEYCYNIQTSRALSDDEQSRLHWLLAETWDPQGLSADSHLSGDGFCIEVGPRMNFTTAWSTNAVSICASCGLGAVTRIERSRRFRLSSPPPNDDRRTWLLNRIHDRMTECPYPAPLTTFDSGVEPEAVKVVPLVEEGRAALERINDEMGLAFDEWDLKYYTDLFLDHIKRNPTNVECFDIAQSNSEHSRHWFFKGKLVVDGKEMPDHLIAMIQRTLNANPANSVVAFSDNSSAIRGFAVQTLHPGRVGAPSSYGLVDREHHILFTAETHNFPSGVAPFPGAETGTGGRIRDTHATGRGSLVVAGTAAYCVGNLRIPGYDLPWESDDFSYPENLASPLEIEIQASNGASDYGNKFGEPVIQGYTRSFGLRLPGGERREWIKPIMFSAGIGQLDAEHTAKQKPEVGMYVVKIGGPAYRIGMGGGAASSMVQGDNAAELDFNAVQRGDAEMEQKVNRVIRACVELGDRNPIISIHDQGAGGNCNVLKEIVEPLGARLNLRAIPVGDETLSALEIWGAEYQENDALLLRPESAQLFTDLCAREKVIFGFVGEVTGDGRVILYDERDDSTPVDLELARVLGDMPQKTFTLDRQEPRSAPLDLPHDLTVADALNRVLRLLSVGSKRFLTNKVDRSVTGLVAQQQCVGPLQLPLADVAVIAQSHFGITGGATAIGEQPIKGLIDPGAMARMTVGEALTNLIWAKATALTDVKCSGNWMWAAKLPGEGAALFDAAEAMCETMIELGIAVDGGKDSLSMAARAPGVDGDETVKAPGALVVSAYVTCPDITKTVTPDLKLPADGRILFVDLSAGLNRLGGSALAQVYGQVGDDSPDLEDSALLVRAFNVVQGLLDNRLISAGHDRSDGGLLTTLLEMAFAGNCGINVDLPGGTNAIGACFSEELGLVLEVSSSHEADVIAAFTAANVPCQAIGTTADGPEVVVKVDGEPVLSAPVQDLRDLWEATSFQLERLQANPDCVQQEEAGLRARTAPPFHLTYSPSPTPTEHLSLSDRPKVAILREEGSNGDREMASAFHTAGFEAWDITMSDLLEGRASLDPFRGVAFVGGFSYADVLDSAKGWAGAIRYNESLRLQFEQFKARNDTFSLGVCNGCQLMALLGWISPPNTPDEERIRFVHNASGRFESRFLALAIEESPAMMLKDMAGSRLGVWVAHGEGLARFPTQSGLEAVEKQKLAPLRYADDLGRPTEAYPFNPNGSPGGIAGICSPDGRHLALMPHPERAFLTWQWPWMPRYWRENLKVSPWIKLFQNARTWCDFNT